MHFINLAGGTTPPIQVEVVSTNDARQLGLMYRRELATDRGMLFIFPDTVKRSFWMKNTYVELDIIFLDDQMRIISISERAVPLSTTPRVSEGPARYVLEVNGGKAKEWGLSKGFIGVVSGELPLAR